MYQTPHQSALASHYNKEAPAYDSFNEENSQSTNRVIANILAKYRIKSVLDLTCGTGSQVFYLSKLGYEVIGSDINTNMLKIAKDRAKAEKLRMKFLKGDMRYSEVGKFDAVVTIFNAVGHLTKADFEIAMRNIYNNLKEDGLYIFDINNLSYLLEGNNITKLTIDGQIINGSIKTREIQYSTIDNSGILASFDTYLIQEENTQPKIIKAKQTLQTYTAKQLEEMLNRNGFAVLDLYAIDGSEFLIKESDRILMVAKRR